MLYLRVSFQLWCCCRYKREDGVDMTATLYLPPGYDKTRDGRLPCIVWAYPKEFKSKDAEGCLSESHRCLHEWLCSCL